MQVSHTRPDSYASGTDRRVESFAVDVQMIRESSGLRLDASHYSTDLARAMAVLAETGMQVRELGQVTRRVFIPPRFKRIYVEKEYGVPFVQGSHLVHFQPADIKYLSRTAHRGLERWIIRKDWVLVTCSGTIGRALVAPSSWDGWAASQHILRIVPSGSQDCPPGYIYAFLRSFPGQAQLRSRIYGAVVDELTERHARSVRIPVPVTKK